MAFSAVSGQLAGELACWILLERCERADLPTPLQIDMVAHVDGLHKVTQLLRCLQPTLGDDMDHANHECELSLLGRT